MITLVLPYPISANRYWISRIVTQKATGRQMVITHPSTEAQAYKREVGWLAKAAGIRTPLLGRTHIECDLYPHRPLDWQKRIREHGELWADTVQCLDLGNCLKVLEDALNGIAYADDKQAHRIELQRMDPDDRPARVVVRISPIVVPKIEPLQQELVA